MKHLLTFLITALVLIQMPIQPAIAKNTKQNSTHFHYPKSEDVEPKIKTENNTALTIKGSIENTYDVTLEDCMKYALGNNPRIQAAMQDIFASDARIKETWASYFPQFSWQSGYSRIRQLQLSDVFRENLIYNYWVLGQISVSQMLFDFGVTRNQASIRKLDNEGYKVILTGTINDVIYNVKDSYYNLQYSIENKKVAEQMVENYSAFYKQAYAFYKAGTKSKIDVTTAEVNLSNAKLALIQSESSVNIAMAKLSNAMGLPYVNRYIINDCLRYEPCDISLDKAIKITEKSRPEFQLADIKVAQAKQNVKLIKKSYFPQLTVEGQYQVGGMHPTSNTGYNLGGYFTFPTINGMLIKHEIREARSLYSKQQAIAQNTKNDIYLDVQKAYYTLSEKKNQIPTALLSVKQAKENYKLSSNRYRVGIGNFVEYQDAQIQYRDAQLTYCKTIYEYNSARANLEKLIGKNITNSEIELDLIKNQKS